MALSEPHGFDSILVRLKESISESSEKSCMSFDSILVRLKDVQPIKTQEPKEVSIPYWFD